MNPTKGNGLTTPHSQPAKTFTKYATDFIARCTLFASSFCLNKGIDAGLGVAAAVVVVQIVWLAVWRVL